MAIGCASFLIGSFHASIKSHSKSKVFYLKIRFMKARTANSKPELIIEAGRAEKQYWHDLWRYRELFYFLAWRDILVRYKQTAIALHGEWLEAFWCNECQANQWYHVRKVGSIYNLSVAPPELWQQANGVVNPHGNPSVGEFTRRNSRMLGFNGVKDFGRC